MKYFMVLLLGIYSVAGFCHREETQPEQSTYQERFVQISFLAKHFPGKRLSFDITTGKKLGLFSGIYHQTLWQLRSGRRDIPLWNIVNAHLTSEIFYFAKSYLNAEHCEPYVEFQKHRCLKWYNYFAAHRNKKARLSTSKMQKIMWKAHSATISSLMVEKDFGSEMETTPRERAFWRGWIQMVYLLERYNYPTTGLFVKPIVARYMPDCAPLDAPNCRVEQFALDQRLFLNYLNRGRVDIWVESQLLPLHTVPSHTMPPHTMPPHKRISLKEK